MSIYHQASIRRRITHATGETERRWLAMLAFPDAEELQQSNRRTEAYLRGYISFSDLCTLMGWDAAERRATLEGLGVDIPEWIRRPGEAVAGYRNIPGHVCSTGSTCDQPGCINYPPDQVKLDTSAEQKG